VTNCEPLGSRSRETQQLVTLKWQRAAMVAGLTDHVWTIGELLDASK